MSSTPPSSPSPSSSSSSHALPPGPFFASYRSHPSPSTDLLTAFNTLAITQNWKRGSPRYRERLARCLITEFNATYGVDTANLARWQRLCRELGVVNLPGSITQCKNVLRTFHVNLIDLLDARRTAAAAAAAAAGVSSTRSEVAVRVRTFPNRFALAEYTRRTRRFCPRVVAKEEGFLKVLLREIM
ncbi:MAG: hypothetical protein M1833_003157 [Piccolia ochrophora]|nr:MAG: hypothetical protein M1833_003157 [Piccolia ochrophora]